MRVPGWVSTLVAAASVAFLAVNAALAASVPEDFVGRWQVIDNPMSTIRFDTAGDALVASKTVYYTYQNGQPTGTGSHSHCQIRRGHVESASGGVPLS